MNALELGEIALRGARALARAGVVPPALPRPSMLPRLALAGLEGVSLGAAVAWHAATRPERVAVVDDLGQLSWGQLDERCNRLAHALLDRTARGRGVATLLRNGREAVEATVAAGRAGLKLLPLNVRAGPEELERVLATQRPALLVAEAELAAVLTDLAVPVLERGGAYEAALAASRSTPPLVRGGTRIVLLTSGTTGTPKGAERAPSSPLAGLPAAIGFLEKVPVRRDDVLLVAPPLFHAFGLGMVVAGVGVGAQLVLPTRSDAETLLEWIDAHDVDIAFLVPVMLARLVELGRAPRRPLRAIVVSGSPLTPHLRARAAALFGDVIYNLYGGTEVGWATIATPEDQRHRPGTVGRAARGMHVFAVGEDGGILPPGAVGRVYVATGTEVGRFTGGTTPERAHGGLSLGDTGWVDAHGYLFLAGRADDMIVSGGENVYPGEVEALLEAHPDLRESAVVGVDDPEFGQALHAFVVAKPGAEVDPAEVRAWVRARVAGFKTPRDVTVLDALPRNATGKVRREDLRARAGARRPTMGT